MGSEFIEQALGRARTRGSRTLESVATELNLSLRTREMRRKDCALAEAAALRVFQKKLQGLVLKSQGGNK